MQHSYKSLSHLNATITNTIILVSFFESLCLRHSATSTLYELIFPHNNTVSNYY